MKILILQNCEYETLGTYARYLVDSGMACDVVHTYQGSIPEPTDYSMLLIGGTPDSANIYYRTERCPWLGSTQLALKN